MAEQRKDLLVVKGSGCCQGVTGNERGIELTISCEGAGNLLLNLYLKDGRHFKVCMNDYHVAGSIYSVLLPKFSYKYFEYSYEYNGMQMKDPYARSLAGRSGWGTPAQTLRYCYYNRPFDWENDAPPKIPCHQLVIYKLHVRGFTKNPNSGVKHKGTFLGVTEKIGYLKSLGINCVELMPVCEFEEMTLKNRDPYAMPDHIYRHEGQTASASADLKLPGTQTNQYKMNYWGYGDAHYFAPKSAYSASADASDEFKQMVLKLHQAGIEVIADFVFDSRVNQNTVLDCLRYWVLEYHLDGFYVNSNVVPVNMAASDPVLAETKLFSEGFDIQGIYGNKPPYFKHLAEYHDEYANCCRRFLKGDEDMVKQFASLLVKNQPGLSSVRYLANHNGFRLADLVAYDEKHNEANGENNKDGTDYNYSWNCGAEGPTRKKKIKSLREQQMKNAWMFMMFHHGIPLIYAGDEFGQSQNGNNNPYCHDSTLTWVNWACMKKNRALFDFAVRLIAFRKAHPVLHSEKPVRLMDYLGCGYPDISFHGSRPWQMEEMPAGRYLGVLYGGIYARKDGRDDSFLYFAYNMHWEPKLIGLPALPGNMAWQPVICTSAVHEPDMDEANTRTGARKENIVIEPRTVVVFESVVGTAYDAGRS